MCQTLLQPAPKHLPGFLVILKTLICWFRCLIRVEAICAGQWPSRNWVWHPCSRHCFFLFFSPLPSVSSLSSVCCFSRSYIWPVYSFKQELWITQYASNAYFTSRYLQCQCLHHTVCLAYIRTCKTQSILQALELSAYYRDRWRWHMYYYVF